METQAFNRRQILQWFAAAGATTLLPACTTDNGVTIAPQKATKPAAAEPQTLLPIGCDILGDRERAVCAQNPTMFADRTGALVTFSSEYAPGMIVVDKSGPYYLYYVTSSGRATRYDIGIGIEKFDTKGRLISEETPVGDFVVMYKEFLPPYGDIPGGARSPMGIAGVNIWRNGVNEQFWLHGNNDRTSIGKKVSHGCIRTHNLDMLELWPHLQVGTKLFVRDGLSFKPQLIQDLRVSAYRPS